ncbi:PREDICTED: claudin-11-like [Branchiostoma belcheri]|uniref:Claudin-11-like n=1 Tax=Branchiostoma belcheri TaxID=7741 RepID=A0A6P5ABX5_BRABE|nr:PREDICTED: claudin-11-like [Branchiostoma belcheri]
MKKLLVLGVGSSFIGMVLLVVGIATVGWLSVDLGFVKRESGLWQACTTRYGGTTSCAAYDMSLLSRNDHTYRAFAVIGAILAISGVFTACCGEGYDADKGKNGGGGSMIAAGVCGMIAAGVFILGSGGLSMASLYGYSFYLTWIQAVFTIGGGIAIIVAGGSATVQPGGEGTTTVQPADGGPATAQPV